MDKDDNKDIDLNNNEDLELDLDLSDDTNEFEADQKDWKAEALKYKSMATRYKGKLSEQKEKPQEEKPAKKIDISETRSNNPASILDSDEFALYREGYSNDEIKLIMHNGGREALKDEKSPLVLGLKTAKEQRRAEEASESTVDKTGQSEIERKYSVEQMKKMSTDELANLIGYAPRK